MCTLGCCRGNPYTHVFGSHQSQGRQWPLRFRKYNIISTRSDDFYIHNSRWRLTISEGKVVGVPCIKGCSVHNLQRDSIWYSVCPSFTLQFRTDWWFLRWKKLHFSLWSVTSNVLMAMSRLYLVSTKSFLTSLYELTNQVFWTPKKCATNQNQKNH